MVVEAYEFKLTQKQIGELLYYETGFEQLHPNIDIIHWMSERGWEYHIDWHCVKVPHTYDQRSYYKLVFE